MRSKRVIILGAAALIAAGLYVSALRGVRVDSRPFDDEMVVTEVALVDDWTLPEGATYMSAFEHEGGTLSIRLHYKGITVVVIRPTWIAGDYVSAMDVQMSALARRADHASLLDRESPWTPVRVRRDVSVMHREGFASRNLRAIVSPRGNSVDAYMWNAERDVAQSFHGEPSTDAELRTFLEFVEAWRVPEFEDEADLKAKWEAFVNRVGGK